MLSVFMLSDIMLSVVMLNIESYNFVKILKFQISKFFSNKLNNKADLNEFVQGGQMYWSLQIAFPAHSFHTVSAKIKSDGLNK
jgi:hypothetical protein